MNMKKILIAIACSVLAASLQAQDFSKNLSAARTSYGSGDLSNARFAMEQMLSNLDVIIGKEILTMLPTSFGNMNFNQKDDNVTGSGSGIAAGLYVHRTYGVSPKSGNIDIINNSPLIASINAMLNTPLVGGMMRSENQKVIKVQGYKSILQRNESSD